MINIIKSLYSSFALPYYSIAPGIIVAVLRGEVYNHVYTENVKETC
jgi:hypothetical protein